MSLLDLKNPRRMVSYDTPGRDGAQLGLVLGQLVDKKERCPHRLLSSGKPTFTKRDEFTNWSFKVSGDKI